MDQYRGGLSFDPREGFGLFRRKLERVLRSAPFCLKEQEQLLVAVSGGPDSMALLHAIHLIAPKYRWSVIAVHINHQLRGEESEKDEEYVRLTCQKWNIPLKVRKVEVLKAKEEQKRGTQEIARTLRYQEFRRVAQECSIQKVLLAHHADDQLETILWNVIRGTSPTGLIGMKEVREEKGLFLLRPLLYFDRIEIEKYCEQEQIFPRQDSSNLSRKYTRNRIRLDLIPYLKGFNPRIKEGMLELRTILQEEEYLLQQLAEDAFQKVVTFDPKESYYQIEVKSFRALPIALQRRVVKLILNCLGNGKDSVLSFQAIERIRTLAQDDHPSKEIQLGKGMVIRRLNQYLLFTVDCSISLEEITPVRLLLPGSQSFLLGTIHGYISEQLHKPLDSNTVVFDVDQLPSDEIWIRMRKNGDRISLFGKDGSKKVKDVLIDAKLPKMYRIMYPIITSGEKILWLPGIRRSGIAPVTEQTRRFLYLEWEPSDLWDRIQTLT